MQAKESIFHVLSTALLCMVRLSCSRSAPQFNSATLPTAEKPCYDAINAAYGRSDAAAVRNDIEGELAIYSSDWIETSQDGPTLDLAKIRQINLDYIPKMRDREIVTAIQDFRMTGSTAVVRIKEHSEETMLSPNFPAGGTSTRASAKDLFAIDTWVYGQQGWLCAKTEFLYATHPSPSSTRS